MQYHEVWIYNLMILCFLLDCIFCEHHYTIMCEWEISIRVQKVKIYFEIPGVYESI